MNSSGIKRGLAFSAITALAVAGLPGSANAATLATQQGANVELRSVEAGQPASVANDGQNTTVSLVATAEQGVQFVTFAYNGTKIGTTGPSANGEFQLEWAPPVGLATATITANATDAAGNPVAPPVAGDSEAGVIISGTISTVEINKPSGDVGYFAQPGAGGAYGANNANVMGISGTTSDSADNLTVSGLGVAAGSPAIPVPALTGGATTQSFNGTVNVDNTALAGAANVPDQVLPVLTTDNGAGSKDAQGFGLYAQQIRGISATQSPAQPNSQTATVTVTVVDQSGKPVAGALVKRDNNNGGIASNGGYTDGKGQVTFTGASLGNQSYFVETTDTAGYEVGVDYRTSISVGASTPDSITFTSKDGDAFDIDEFDNGDLSINVKDAAGTNLPGQTFFYKWTFTPFEPSATSTTQTSKEMSVATGNNGSANVPLPQATDFTGGPVNTLNTTGGTLTLQGYVNRGTNPGQDPTDLALAPKDIKRGESDVFFDGPTTTTRPLETTQTVNGSVKLIDGTVLGGRSVNVSYTPGDDSVLSTTQPAGTTRLSNTAATVVTGTDGTFSVSVTDPDKTPNQAENGTLSAVGTGVVGSGANQKNGIGNDAGTAAGTGYSAASDDVTIQFSADAAAKFITAGPVTEADLGNALGNGLTPGRPGQFTITLANSQSNGLAGQQVTLKTDHGFFTPNATAVNNPNPSGLTADPAAAEGGEVGEWKSLGDTITVTTDQNGQATVTVAIEKDAGFDDDGKVIANITATADQATNTNPITVDFRTDNSVEPLNPSTVELVAANNPGVALPDARVGQQVRHNLFAKDQFGNLVADEVNVSDNTPSATFTNENVGGQVLSQFTSQGPAVTATATAETDQILTATWNQATTVYTDGNAATPGFQPSIRNVNNNTETDAADTINWYVVDFANSDFTVTTDPEGEVQVGAPVIERVRVLDQKGNPVPGLQVAFIRQGPDTNQNGDPNQTTFNNVTNANGEAIYAFTGTQPGDANISIVVTDGNQVKTLTDKVTFVGKPSEDKVEVEALISGDSNGGQKDVVRFQVDDAAEGAEVTLFKIRGKKSEGNKRLVQIRQDIVPEGGTLTFKVADRNGSKKTRFIAKVAEGDNNLAAKSNTQKLR